MKKFIALALCAVMLGSLGLAEEIDISGMSVDELLALRVRIDDQLAAMLPSDSSAIFRGVYIVGTDIAPGKYVFECTEVSVDDYGQLEINESEDEDGYREEILDVNIYPGDKCYLDLTEGMLMEIEDGSGTLKKAEGLDWMP